MNLKKHIIFITVIFVALLSIGIKSYAVNEGITLVGGKPGEYLIYIQGNENTEFEFSFTNMAIVDKTTLDYRSYAEDAFGDKIAYVNSNNISIFGTTTYMYARIIGTANYIIDGIEIDLNKKIDAVTLEEISSITKKIPTITNRSVTKTGTIDGREVTFTRGEIILTDVSNQYEYIMIKASGNPAYSNLLNLMERVSKFNASTNIITKITVDNAFLEEYELLMPTVADINWLSATNNEIYEPEDATEGDEYIVWIKETKTNVIDVHLMSAHKQYLEERIIENLNSALPRTGDNYTLLILLTVLIALIIIIAIVGKRQSVKDCLRGVKYENKKMF